jgi:hypothetical protein
MKTGTLIGISLTRATPTPTRARAGRAVACRAYDAPLIVNIKALSLAVDCPSFSRANVALAYYDLSRMVIEGTPCHENSRLHRDWRADRPTRAGIRRPVSARQAVVVSRRSRVCPGISWI